MKKQFFTALCILCALASACTSDEPDNLPQKPEAKLAINDAPADTLVVIHFSRFEVVPMTRSAVSDVSNYLDVWITDGTETVEIHQDKETAGFGTVSVRLEKAKTYTLYVTAHKGDGAATLADGIISWPNDKIRDTFYGSLTFTPGDDTSFACELTRIVAQLKLTTTDAVPDDAAKLSITMGSVHDRWNLTDGAAHETDRTATFSPINTYADGTTSFTMSAITTSEQTTHTVTIQVFDSSDNVIQTKTLANVPLRNGHRTQYVGELFTNKTMSMSFSIAADWTDDDPITF